MQVNDEGKVALKYRQPGQVLVQQTPSGVDYVFVVRANISLAWIKPEDVDNILARRKRCCGGNNKVAYIPANEDDVRRWTNNGGR